MGIGSAIGGIIDGVTGLFGGGGSSGLGGLGNLIGSGISAASQLEAGNIQADAATDAINEQLPLNAQVMANYEPLTSMMPGMTNGLENLLGVGPDGAAGMTTFLEQTPGYQFALDQGLRSVQSGLSAQGLAKSGSAIKGAAQFSTGLASQTYQNMVSNFMNGGQLALSGTNSFTNAAFTGQNTLNNLILAKGAAKAAGLVGASNVVNNGLMTGYAMNNIGGMTPTQTYNGSPVGNAVGTMLSTNPFGTGTNQIALQNPYQIQAPNFGTFQPDLNQLGAFTPTLPTG